ncbi:hypothetical protein CAPTEDRAFT_69307, partial [Capitella teleta]
AFITPVFLGGGHTLPQNYRPISVLPAFSKVFERLLHDRINEYFTINQIISSN